MFQAYLFFVIFSNLYQCFNNDNTFLKNLTFHFLMRGKGLIFYAIFKFLTLNKEKYYEFPKKLWRSWETLIYYNSITSRKEILGNKYLVNILKSVDVN